MMDAFDRAVERDAQIRRARRTRPVWRRLGVHLRIYVLVNLALVGMWLVESLVTNEDETWFVHVLWGWGIGLLVHYLVVTQVTKQWLPPRETNAAPDSPKDGDR